jgi:antitoxin component of RelBE/YafQ-DinJ toxin-antitoxin module
MISRIVKLSKRFHQGKQDFSQSVHEIGTKIAQAIQTFFQKIATRSAIGGKVFAHLILRI